MRPWPLALLLLAACGEAPRAPGGDGATPGGVLTVGAQPPLNDTGVVHYIDDGNDGTRPYLYDSAPSGWQGQDADLGRDRDGHDADGRAGFRFTRLDADGRPLGIDAPDHRTTPWDCVRDEVTGLVWEVKVDDPGSPRHYLHTFSWYDPDPERNGGFPGARDQGSCNKAISGLSHCDTAAYIAHLNDIALCGFDDWRLPTVPELLSIVDYGATREPLIDPAFFPHTAPSDHWSSQTQVGATCPVYDADYRVVERIEGGNAWEVHFDKGHAETHCKMDNRQTGSVQIHVRAVRGPS